MKKLRHGGDHRGSAAARRARKNWMLIQVKWQGEWRGTHTVPGQSCLCQLGLSEYCERILTFPTIQADRIDPGGPYARHNIQPACGTCNRLKSDTPEPLLSTRERVRAASAVIREKGKVDAF